MQIDHGPCPKCGTEFTIWKLPRPVMLHWVLNPGLVVNELLLGQRVPRVMLVCDTCAVPLIDRSYIPCDKCGVLNSSRCWSPSDAFAHWLGMVCPNCGQRIASLWNAASLVVLAITLPLWYLPYRFYFRDRRVKLPTYRSETPVVGKKLGVWSGIAWGLFMWLLMSCLPVAIQLYRGQVPDWSQLWIGVILWSIAGVVFGYSLQRVLRRKLVDPPP